MRIRRVLIANRGEIAVRIIRTCRALGIETVVAASEADIEALPARLADRALCIGPARPGDSYLKVDTIVQAALGTAADAVHPGYGFLSERAALARRCEQAGLIFIGPTPDQIELAGDKLRARAEAAAAGLPLVPGGEIGSLPEAMRLAQSIGTPLLLKAAGGGGGRGLRRVDAIDALPEAMALSASEAESAFGDARLYLERFVNRGRHVEVQILGDGLGGLIELGERDCSVQRRYQKLLEESPAPALSGTLRERLCTAAVRFGERLAYRGAGTVEFLLDAQREAFYFIEMNARIQVEHPVTEAVTGVDLVAQQIAIAAGERLTWRQDELQRHGCALECRINAEDPAQDFRPVPGIVRSAHWPAGDGIRVDTHIQAGTRVPPYYDSLLGKIIAHGEDRSAALERMRRALAATRIEGVPTNVGFHARLIGDAEFQRGGVDTGYVARLLARAPGDALQVPHG